jgi:hypothetical protein
MKQQSGDRTWNLEHSSFFVSISLKNETITSPFKLILLPDLVDVESSLSLGLGFLTFISSTYILFLHLAQKLVSLETITSPFKLILLPDLVDVESSLSLNLHFIHLYPFSPSSTEIGDNLKVGE